MWTCWRAALPATATGGGGGNGIGGIARFSSLGADIDVMGDLLLDAAPRRPRISAMAGPPPLPARDRRQGHHRSVRGRGSRRHDRHPGQRHRQGGRRRGSIFGDGGDGEGECCFEVASFDSSGGPASAERQRIVRAVR
jgi:hypothetical protein